MREPQAKDQRKRKISLLEHWGVFSETWPTSGTMRNGQLFERQTLVRPTGENECSLLPTPLTADSEGLADAPGDARRKTPRLSATGGRLLPLLRTPCAAEADGGLLHPDVARDRNQTLRLSGQILALTGDLLPTPQARDWKGVPGDGFNVASLPRTVNRLLPTPLVANNENRQSDGYGPNLGAVITSRAWGEFAPAIERWEHVLGRAAPAPTQTNRTGKPQLSPRFVEWMMGLPAGWVTDVDISRANQLRALGNGVVPQQGAAAVTHLLGRS